MPVRRPSQLLRTREIESEAVYSALTPVPIRLFPKLGATRSFPDAFLLIGDSIRDFVWLSDGAGKPIHQNLKSRSYTGCDVSELGPDGWSALCHPDDRPQFADAWNRAVLAGKPFEIEFRCERGDGAFCWFHCQAAPVDAAGETQESFWIATLTDVHQHRVLEGELIRAVRNRDEFLAALAHEMRTPLQAMRQATIVAQSPAVNNEAARHMHAVIERQLSLLLRFAEESLDVSRVRWNAMSLVPASITLEALVEQATEGIRPVIESSGLALEVELDQPDCEMIADPDRLIQALTNMMGNAAKFGRSGGRIRLKVYCDDGHAVFEVRDWGCGIEPARLDEIFELFARLPDKPHAHGRVEGLGIGLAIAQHVARLHGGTLTAHSEGIGCGSQFTMRVPLAAAVASTSSSV